MDVAAIASALATRVGAVTAPTGYDTVQLATHLLPNAIVSTPTVLVFPPAIDSVFSGHKRSTDLVFPVRFFIAMTSDRPRSLTELYAWQENLFDQLKGLYDLGLNPPVTHAVILSMSAGTGEYGEKEYAVIELDVGVHVEEGYAPTTQ